MPGILTRMPDSPRDDRGLAPAITTTGFPKPSKRARGRSPALVRYDQATDTTVVLGPGSGDATLPAVLQ